MKLYSLALLGIVAASSSGQTVPTDEGFWYTITDDDFESNLGSYVDGGNAAARSSRRAKSGRYSVEIKDDKLQHSSFYHGRDYEVSRYYEALRVRFWFYMDGLDGEDDFVVEHSSDNGHTFTTHKQFMISENTNNAWTEAEVEINEAHVEYTRIRFKSHTSHRDHRIYIDNVKFEGWSPEQISPGGEAPDADIAAKVATSSLNENISEYRSVFALDIPARPSYGGGHVGYSEDNRMFQPVFSRVAYYLELESVKFGSQWLWVSMEPFTSDAGKLGVPTANTGAVFQKILNNVKVASNVAALNGDNLEGNIEFWPNNYSTKNTKNIPGASGSTFDFGDERSTSGDHGSMQIHVPSLQQQVMFGFNNWNRGNKAGLGIGNNPGSSHIDWTFADNAGEYTKSTMQIFLKPGTLAAPTATGNVVLRASNVDDINDYRLVYELDIPSSPNFRSSLTYKKEYTVAQPPFTRIAYYLELDDQWIFVSMDAFTDDLSKIGVPTFASGAVFQQPLTNLNVASSKEELAGIGIGGNIEFWPNNYGTSNQINIPGASGSTFDFGDERSTGGTYGSMQIHSPTLGETLFAFNYWNAGRPANLGIGNSDAGHPDWTFNYNAGSYTKRTMQIFVK